ncbi:MAG: ADP-forming succinate--CoA ligase subunit beta [Vampirovibrionales bacterium]
MKIHEYQAKALFRQFGISVPSGSTADTPQGAVEAATQLSTPKVVVKAQIHAGGRGKGGGVKVVDNTPEAVRTAAEAIIGMQLVTHQTSAEGQKVKTVLIEEGSNIERELYLALVMDRATSRVVLMASTEGGMDIEEVAEHTPEKIVKIFIHPALGLQAFEVRQVCSALQLQGEQAKQAAKLMNGLYQMFIQKDCALLEINPLIVTKEGNVVALDGKVNFDSNALYRHADIVALRDLDEEDPLEVEASKFNLNYIKLDGQVACMVNGAGLAMATMDIVNHYGAAPANFLDVGGSANEEAITNAFRIIMSDPDVKVVFINIFGGILRCDLLAQGVVNAAKNLDMKLPIVVRMKGTNVDLGKKILVESGIKADMAELLEDAAQKVVSFLQPATV